MLETHTPARMHALARTTHNKTTPPPPRKNTTHTHTHTHKNHKKTTTQQHIQQTKMS